MNLNIVKSFLILVIIFIVTTASPVIAEVEISIENTLKTGAVPIDVALSPDGRLTFVLTDDGSVLVYDDLGNRKEVIKIGPHIDRIEIGPSGERLFASSRQKKTVDIILLSFISDINTDGAVYKGPEDAPVTIAVFSEFQ
jgi:hypothetical protein